MPLKSIHKLIRVLQILFEIKLFDIFYSIFYYQICCKQACICINKWYSCSISVKVESQPYGFTIANKSTQYVYSQLKPASNESQKTLNKCETRNKTVFDTRLRHPETINSVPLNSVLRIKQTCV